MALTDVQPWSVIGADADTLAIYPMQETAASTDYDNYEGDANWDATPNSGNEPAVSTDVPNSNYDRSRVFDNNDFASVATPTEFQNHSGAFTLDTMLMLEDVDPADTECFLGTYGTTDGNRKFFFQRNSGGNKDKLDFGVISGNTSYIVTTTAALSRGVWHYVVAVFVPSTSLTIFVDGVQAGQVTSGVPATLDTDSTTLCIGRYNTSWGGNNAFAGKLVDIRISKVARTSTEIADHWSGDDAGTAYTQDITETLTLVEGITLDPAKAIEEVATLVESVTRTTTTAFTDAITLVDDLATQLVYDQQVSEAVTLIETLGDFVIGKQVTETVTAVETVARSLGRSIVDALTLVETVEAQTADYLQSVDETVTMVDTNTNVYTAGRATEDSVTVNEHLYGLLNGINMFWQDTYTDVTDTWSDIYLDY